MTKETPRSLLLPLMLCGVAIVLGLVIAVLAWPRYCTDHTAIPEELPTLPPSQGSVLLWCSLCGGDGEYTLFGAWIWPHDNPKYIEDFLNQQDTAP